jgi:hypothetical protein
MPESPRKRSAPARKADPEVVPAETPAATKPAKAAKKATNATSKATAAGKAAKKAAPQPVEEPAPVPAEGEAGGDEPEFLNRAARRAKGRKDTGGQPVSGKGPTYTGRGAVPGQRQWGARRSGG